MIRVILAGIIGGVLVFCAGAFNHMVLELEGRGIRQLPNETEVRDFFARTKLAPGIYGFPHAGPGFKDMAAEEQAKEWERLSTLYKEGPAAFIVVAPTGEEMMGPMQLGPEFGTNVLAALIAAWIVFSTAPGTSYPKRWLIVLMLGLFTWVCTSASYAIWYRFPWPFILDGLLASLIEWGFAGLVIAAIAWPRAAETETKPENPGTAVPGL
jgi:hypothetical protein